MSRGRHLRPTEDATVPYGVLDPVLPFVRRMLAPNPSPFTERGTWTFVVGHGRVAVIDPGPALPSHTDSLLHALRGETVVAILVTHAHIDHSPGVAAIKAATGAATYGYGPDPTPAFPNNGVDYTFVPDRTLADGGEVHGHDWRLTAVHTPGHASNHLCFALDAEGILFTGDHIMGWSTTVISPPDGNLADYKQSLEKVLRRDDRVYLPAHGPMIIEPKKQVRSLLELRQRRTAVILARLRQGDRTVDAIVNYIYTGLPAELVWAAKRMTLAHLAELVASGEVVSDGPIEVESHYRLAVRDDE